MFNFYSLSSSSSGNCLLIQSNRANILIDIGISLKKINTELEKISLSLNDITAILITHEHSDHCKSLNSICKKFNHIPVYVNKPTYIELKKIYTIDKLNVNIISVNNSFSIEDLNIIPFEIPHDAVAPCGYTIYKDDKKMTIATDVGIITDDIFHALSNSNFAFIESNYETEMLNTGRYPYYVKKRIASNVGHLSNTQCSDVISKLVQNNTRHFMLGHLSNENNTPDLALKSVESSLLCNNISLDNIQLSVAKKDCLSTIVSIE